MINAVNRLLRYLHGTRRPSKGANVRQMRKRGETIDSFTIREANCDDVTAIANTHVTAWNDTYGKSKKNPTLKLREQQWREIFKNCNSSWFCVVVENKVGEIVGFAKAQVYKHEDLPEYDGELNKLYILREYQRIGIGRKLFLFVVRKFLTQGINTMVVFGTPQISACKFYELMGGKKLYDKRRIFQGGYGWNDLQKFVLEGELAKA
jgi:GNAT superfamily N-acetyltransferase